MKEEDLLKEAQQIGLPFFPGVMTPTDIDTATSLGANVLKFFPAEAAGGTKMLKALTAPYTHLGIKFFPTGGITLDNMKEYLSLPTVCAVGGTWIATKELIANQQWQKITDNAKAAVQLVAQFRSNQDKN